MIDEERLALLTDRVAAYDRDLPGFADTWAKMTKAILSNGGVAVVPYVPSNDWLPSAKMMMDLLAERGALQVTGSGGSTPGRCPGM